MQHIELGQRNVGHAAQAHAFAQDNGVQPAAAAGAASGGPEFVALGAQVAARVVKLLGGEGAGAHAGGVGLDDAHHAIQRRGADAATGGSVARHGIGRGHKGIGAMVDIQMDALSAFKKNVAALGLHFLQAVFHFGEVGRDARGQSQQFFADSGFVQGIKFVEVAQQGVFFLQGVGHLGAHQGRIGEVAGAQAYAGGLVFIAGADATTGGTDLVGGALGLAGFVQAFVVGHDEVGFLADAEPGRGNVNALGGEMVHLFKKHKGIKHHAVADEADFAFVQDA